ncbi:MAG: SEL1-like repeat protein, partial [Undibacterium sp.]|nr:SEL1-like repeat protein [Opitutaceae bacterium]
MRPSARQALRLLAAALALPLASLRAADTTLPPALASLRQKAESGNAIAQYNLGLAYAQGRDTPADLSEAFVWLSLAADSGSTGRALDSLLRDLSPAQLSEGLRRLSTRPRKPAPVRP